MKKTLLNRFWFWLFWHSTRKLCRFGGACANRYTRQFMIGKTEFTIIQRDTSEPDMHSREEVYKMLQTVRINEERMKWKCPEPEVIRGRGQ